MIADLATARARLTEADAALFDRCRVAAQAYADADRAGAELLLSVVGLNPPGQPFDGVMLPHDSAFDQRDIGDHRSLCGVLRERVLERLGVTWPFLTAPLARRDPMPPRPPPIAAECSSAKTCGAYVDTTRCTDLPDVAPLDGLFVGAPYAGVPGVWTTGGEFAGAHARTPVLVAGAELLCVSGGGPGNHFEHQELRLVGTELWCGRWGAGWSADGRPRVGRRVFALTRTGMMPRGGA